MTTPYDDDDVIALGGGYGDEPDLGPDERDMDLMDGSWEQQYYAGQQKRRDWHAIQVGLGLLVLIALLIPALMVLFG
ncbi:MAG: hypothetical protein ACM3S1_05055 [Hyphomicrobiales bacterium]